MNPVPGLRIWQRRLERIPCLLSPFEVQLANHVVYMCGSFGGPKFGSGTHGIERIRNWVMVFMSSYSVNK